MKVRIVTAAGLAALLAAGAAAATTLEFTYTSPSDSNGTASWTQSSTPIVLSHGGIFNTDTDVVVANGTESFPGYGSDLRNPLIFDGAGDRISLAGV
jgi:hypothetical protein